MKRWFASSPLGICIGFLAAVALLAKTGGQEVSISPNGPMLSECDGRIESVVIQYVAGAQFAAPIYRQLLQSLSGDVRVYVVCPDQSALNELRSSLGPVAGRLRPIVAGHTMTAWSRDRWVALMPKNPAGAVSLVAPRGENGAAAWPQRMGDQRIAEDLGDALAPGVRAVRSGLYFDGGDLLADSHSVFVSPAAIARNLQHTAGDRESLRKELWQLLHRTPILLDDAPDHHVGMYMMAAGDNRVVVGDPSLARPLFSPMSLPQDADFSNATQARFDSVATAAIQAGYRVVRIPCVPAGDGKTYLTYVNGLIDQRDGRRTIYMPSYQGQARLNAAAETIWAKLGYRVVPIDVTSAYRNFGTLHCLVNVIEKVQPPRDALIR